MSIRSGFRGTLQVHSLHRRALLFHSSLREPPLPAINNAYYLRLALIATDGEAKNLREKRAVFLETAWLGGIHAEASSDQRPHRR